MKPATRLTPPPPRRTAPPRRPRVHPPSDPRRSSRVPAPEARRITGFGFSSFARGFAAILAMERAGVVPAVLDFGDRPSAGGASELYAGFDGFREEVDASVTRAASICAAAGGEPLPDDNVSSFWESRHEPAENFAKRRAAGARPGSPYGDERTSFDYVHVSLPASAVLAYREEALRIASGARVDVVESGVWVRPGLVSLTFVARGVSREDAVARMEAATDGCVRLAHEHGGSMEYCHGVGLRLAHLMKEEHGPALGVMRRMKRGLDPQGLLNPGKSGLSE